MKITADTNVLLRFLVDDDPQQSAAVEAGLKVLEAGGDFADGVIAFDGAWQGGDVFVSFDKRAVKALKSTSHPCRLLSGKQLIKAAQES